MSKDLFPIGSRFRTPIGVLRIHSYPAQSLADFTENRAPMWDYVMVDEGTGAKRGVFHEFLTEAAGIERLEDFHLPSIDYSRPAEPVGEDPECE